MDWNAERTREALRQIAALLLVFAALAERAAGWSRPGRRPVLWVLRRAERVAREFVTGESDDGIPVAEPAPSDADLTEAARLALSFRALASLLAVLAGQARHPARHRPEPEIRAILRRSPGIVRRVPAPDTS